MGLVVAGGWHVLQLAALGPRQRDALALAGLIPVAMAFYGAALWTLRIEGRDDLKAILARLRERVRSARRP